MVPGTYLLTNGGAVRAAAPNKPGHCSCHLERHGGRVTSVCEACSVHASAAPRKYPQQIVALLTHHEIYVDGDPRPFTVAEVDRHFKVRGTSLDDRFACKAALRQIGQLQ